MRFSELIHHLLIQPLQTKQGEEAQAGCASQSCSEQPKQSPRIALATGTNVRFQLAIV